MFIPAGVSSDTPDRGTGEEGGRDDTQSDAGQEDTRPETGLRDTNAALRDNVGALKDNIGAQLQKKVSPRKTMYCIVYFAITNELLDDSVSKDK